jgi:hypothetical protein
MIKTVFESAKAISPAKAFDFAASSALPDVSFSRTGNFATRINNFGLVEILSSDVPRFDFDPITGRCDGLLIEEQRENIIHDSVFSSFSSTTSNNIWIEAAAQLDATPNFDTAPDGTQSAALLAINTASSNRTTSYRTGNAVGGRYALSVFAKANSTDDKFSLFLSGEVQGTNGARVEFSLSSNGSAGAVQLLGTGSNGVARIKALKNGWYRCVVVVTLTSPANITALLYPGTRSSQTTASETLVWGAQIESGDFETSYIATTSGAVTRGADVAIITGADFDGFWKAGKGAALVKARPSTVSGIRPVLQFDDTTADNIIALRGNAANPELYVRTGGMDQAQIDAGTIAASASYRLAGAWATNDCAASLNSGTPVLDGVATIPTVTQARLGSDGTNYLNGHIEAIEYYDERLFSASLQVLSSQAGRNSIIGSVFRDSIIA